MVYATIVKYALFARIPHFNQTVRSISGRKFKIDYQIRNIILNKERSITLRCGARCFEVQLTSGTEVVKARTPAEARKIIRSTINKSDIDILSVRETKRNR